MGGMRGYLGLALFWVGAVYLILTHPFLPGWAWGLLLAVLLLELERRYRIPGMQESGVLLFGWGVGAALADATGLFSLKLVGVGTALLALGWVRGEDGLRYLGAALVVAGGLVGLFEVGAAPWVALLLVAAGIWLLLRGGEPEGEDPEFERRYRRLLAWRRQKAEERGLRVDEVLPDALLPELARAQDREAIEKALGPEREAWVEELAALLLEAQRVP